MNLSPANWIDLIIVVFFTYYIWDKAKKGLIDGTIDMASFLLSLLLALKLYSICSPFLLKYFGLSRGISNASSFLIIAFVAEPILYFLGSLAASHINKKVEHSQVNRSLGFIPAIITATILLSFLITTLLALPIRPDIKQALTKSQIGGAIAQKTLGTEKILSDIFGGAAQETINFLTVKPQGDETVDLRFKTNEVTIDTQAEEEMLVKVNTERRKRGIPTLIKDAEIQKVARAHCQDMFRRGYFSHYTPEGLSPFDRMEKAGIEYNAAGENLAYAPTLETAHQGLMESLGHRANILSDKFGRLGIGVINAGIYGRMFCQEFRN